MLRAVFTNSFGILFSRILGFVRDLLTASILGANIYSDIFFVAFKLPNLFRRIFAEGAFVQSFLPSFTASKHKSLFSAAVFLRFILFLLFFSLIVTLFSPFFTKLIAVGFDEKSVSLASPYVALNFYYLDLIFAVTFFASLLQYKNHFATTAFSTALLNISLIAALLISKGERPEIIVWHMSFGVIIGGILQLIAHIIAAKKLEVLKILILGFKYLRKKSYLVKDEVKRFYRSFFPAILGNSTAQISAFLDTWLASFLAAGNISYLYYANRVFQLPLALFAIATSTAIFPKVARFLKKGDEEEAIFLLKKSFVFLLFLLSAFVAGGIVLSNEVVTLLFQRGAFGEKDAEITAFVLSMYLIGLLPYGLSKIFSLWLYSLHRQKEAAKIASYSLIVNIILSLILIYPLKAAGLALASSIAGFVLLFYTLREFGFDKLKGFLDLKILIYLSLFLVIEIFALLFVKELFKI
ncbi:MAG: murein biosynthesis integral membrane protein MurJ [Epsilonproteobacteria bacterium]|nr:murein biosynthesis integral membrane protein MurJ [Campylobacterota bacterium]